MRIRGGDRPGGIERVTERLVALAFILALVPLATASAQEGAAATKPAPAGTGAATAASAGGTTAAEGETPTPEAIAAAGRALEGGDAWLLVEQGRVALENGAPGAALDAFLKAKEAAGRDVYPEVDLELGDFWRGEGEFAQAERSYKKALDDLRIAQNLTGYREYDYQQLRIVLLEHLGELYRLTADYGAMEEQYAAIAQADRDFVSGALPDRVTRNFEESGLNKVLMLYRLDAGFAVRAHAELGWLYYRAGRYEKAVTHSVFAVTNILSAVINELRRVDPQYAFASVEVTLRDGYRRGNTREYLEETGVWKALYYLAAESHALGHAPRAKEIWQVIQRSRDSGQYQSLAAKQLARPWVEPPLESYRGSSR
jgi:tetratricopeptide (TPR) repeat protein